MRLKWGKISVNDLCFAEHHAQYTSCSVPPALYQTTWKHSAEVETEMSIYCISPQESEILVSGQ